MRGGMRGPPGTGGLLRGRERGEGLPEGLPAPLEAIEAFVQRLEPGDGLRAGRRQSEAEAQKADEDAQGTERTKQHTGDEGGGREALHGTGDGRHLFRGQGHAPGPRLP